MDNEAKFMAWFKSLPWYAQYQKQYGETPSPNTPDYDYRKAYQFGITPEPYQHDKTQSGEPAYHWPSVAPNGYPLKAINHPTAWMEDYMRLTGKDPHTPQSALSQLQANQLTNALMLRYGGQQPTNEMNKLRMQMKINKLLGD